ncbi:MAG: hypothetical protein LBG80_05900 [Bacteroidales bacterium]|jgi:hypothetical protein|nr:hypothetical protein [Bacteroidales bacterium]
MIKIALFVIYNHRYDKNIDKVEELYRDKFTHIFHVIPFYDGNRSNVLPVYANSIYFQSYIAQAFQQISHQKEQYSHYFIVADDMLLNPCINEKNIFDFLNLDMETCYIKDIREPHKKCYNNRGLHWAWLTQFTYKMNKPRVEIKTVLPSKEEAVSQFEKHKIDISPIKLTKQVRSLIYCIYKAWYGLAYRTLITIFQKNKINYPLVWAYSDCLLIPHSVMLKFCTCCGAFAATDLNVELAIPTALLLCTDKISTDNKLGIKSIANEIENIKKIENMYNFDLQKLIKNFPEDVFFIHPIKLSKWK